MSTHVNFQSATWFRPILLGWMMLCALSGIVPVAMGADVLIVMSSDARPYVDAADKAERTLKGRGHSTTQVSLSDTDLDSLSKRSGAVITIGGEAAARLAKVLPDTTPLYYCMTPLPDRLGLTRRANTSGISTDPDIATQIDLIERSGIHGRRVGMLYRESSESSRALRDRFQAALPTNWSLKAIDLDSTGSTAAKSIDALFREEIDIVWTAADTAVFDSALVKALLLRSIRDRVPMFGFSHALVRAGAPLGVGFEPEAQGLRVADMLHAEVLGVHEPSDTQLAINLTALERIGLTLSSDLKKSAKVRFGED